jgi:hypothetical protein
MPCLFEERVDYLIEVLSGPGIIRRATASLTCGFMDALRRQWRQVGLSSLALADLTVALKPRDQTHEHPGSPPEKTGVVPGGHEGCKTR